MKIGIDIRCLADGKNSGVEEYTINLLHSIFAMDEKNAYILFLNIHSEPKIDLRQFNKYKNVSIRRFRIPNKILNFCFWYLRWPNVDEMIGGVDFFFMPNINFVSISNKAKLILTMHDLSFEFYPQTFSLKRRLWHQFVNPRRLCKRADTIIAISESTASDIVGRYGINPEKVEQIYNGTSDEFREIDRNDPHFIEVKEKYHLPFNFIFYLGTIEPRKNIISLVRAYDQLRSLNNPQLEKYKLVIAGGKGWKVESILHEMRNAKYTKDIIYTSQITNEDKPYVYNLASLFVYPSFFEGFGFPVLEAMKCKVPVITSNTSSLPEVVGDAGIMIDPDKPDELFVAMREVLLSKNLQDLLREKEWKQAFKFHWRKTAYEFLKVLEKKK